MWRYFYVTPQGYYVIKVITNKVITSRCIKVITCHGDVGQSQNVSKSADFRCEKMHFCSSESRESRIFGISALKTIVLRNKTKLFFRPATSPRSWADCLPSDRHLPSKWKPKILCELCSLQAIDLDQTIGLENVIVFPLLPFPLPFALTKSIFYEATGVSRKYVSDTAGGGYTYPPKKFRLRLKLVEFCFLVHHWA